MVFCIGNTKKGTREMNNEPVAWIVRKDTDEIYLGKKWAYEYAEYIKADVIPLYTHPAKTQDEGYETVFDGEKYTTKLKEPAKTLTDEEITQVFDECYPNNADGDVVTLIDFARAILRKAQEK